MSADEDDLELDAKRSKRAPHANFIVVLPDEGHKKASVSSLRAVRLGQDSSENSVRPLVHRGASYSFDIVPRPPQKKN